MNYISEDSKTMHVFKTLIMVLTSPVLPLFSNVPLPIASDLFILLSWAVWRTPLNADLNKHPHDLIINCRLQQQENKTIIRKIVKVENQDMMKYGVSYLY